MCSKLKKYMSVSCLSNCYFVHLEKSTFKFSLLHKKIPSLEPYLKSVGFKDKVQRISKKLFSVLKVNPRHRLRRSKKNRQIFVLLFLKLK
jgi:hypothetical protein